MSSYNRVLLMGNLTRDVEVRYTGSGTAVATMGLAINRRYATRGGEQREETTFVDIDVWDRQAENCQKYLSKGSPVFVEGTLQMDEWEDRTTGQKRSRLKVRAVSVQFLGSGDNRSERGHSGAPAANGGGYSTPKKDRMDEQPAPGRYSDAEGTPASDDEPIDDIPF